MSEDSGGRNPGTTEVYAPILSLWHYGVDLIDRI